MLHMRDSVLVAAFLFWSLFNPSRLLAHGGVIIVQVRTNATPGVQFDSIYGQLFTAYRRILIDTATHVADVTTDYESGGGVRLAQWTLPDGYDDGWYSVTIALRLAGETVARRTLLLESCCHAHPHVVAPPLNRYGIFLGVSDVVEIPPVALHNWYSRSRADNFATTLWTGASGETRSPDYEWLQLMGYALPLQAPGTIPLYHWYSPDRGDNLTTTDPNWAGSAGDTRDGYGFAGVIAYVFSDPETGAIPLYSWYSPSRGDNFLSTNWVGGPGDIRSPDYRFVREEGYILSATNSGPFARGDCNDDGVVDISDAVFMLGSLFLGQGNPGCDDACDSNDDGAMDLSDAIYTLTWAFLGGPAPPDPQGTCGLDPTEDGLTCLSFEGCTQP